MLWTLVAGSVAHWCSRNNGSFEPSPVPVVKRDPYQRTERTLTQHHSTLHWVNALPFTLTLPRFLPLSLFSLFAFSIGRVNFLWQRRVSAVIPVVSKPGDGDRGKLCLLDQFFREKFKKITPKIRLSFQYLFCTITFKMCCESCLFFSPQSRNE